MLFCQLIQEGLLVEDVDLGNGFYKTPIDVRLYV